MAYYYDDGLSWKVGSVVALGLAGVLTWGLMPAQSTTLRVEYGAWETQIFLKERYESCGYESVTVGDERKSVYRCRDHTRTLDQESNGGICNPQVCDPAMFPVVSEEWEARVANDSDLFVAYGERYTLFFRDLEASGEKSAEVFTMDFSASDYSNLIPAIGGNVQSTRNNFGAYSRPR